jgi:hypothetical protein
MVSKLAAVHAEFHWLGRNSLDEFRTTNDGLGGDIKDQMAAEVTKWTNHSYHDTGGQLDEVACELQSAE